MLWRIIVTLWWLGVGISFLVSAGLSVFALFGEEEVGGKIGAFVGIWARWVLGVIGGFITLFILAFVLGFLGFDVAGFSVAPR